MARCGLGWKSQELASRAGVSYPSVHRFEAGQTVAADTLAKLEQVLVAAGVQFTRRSGRVGVTVPE